MKRARINERLERAARFPVTLVIAPAGFGKSSALRDFLEASRVDALRYDVKREDNTLLAFVHRLSEALEPVAPGALASFAPMQERVLAATEPVRQLSDWFAEHLKDAACTIAIDDLHYAAADPASIALLADLIERCGERIRWIVAARSDVGLPIGTWIAYGRMDLPIGEDELRFTSDEALAAADAHAVELDAHEVESLRQLTEGWPVAVTIALRTRTHSRDLRSAAFGTREMVYRYLAEQVYAALSPEQRAFALATSVFSGFDMHVVEAIGANREFLRGLRTKIAFLNEPSPGQYRYHELFRDFLETELRRSGDREWAQAMQHAAQILERREEFASALLLYAKAQAATNVVNIVAAHGFSLFEHGEIEALATALDAVPQEVQHEDARILGIRGMIHAARGRFEAAERDLLAAIAQSRDDALKMRLVYRYALESIRRGRNCIAFLEPYALDDALPDRLRMPLLGTLATAYASAQRKDEAAQTIARALDLCDAATDQDVQARLYQQASYAFFVAGQLDRARTYAEMAAELATAQNLHEVAARAYLNLFVVVYEQEDSPVEWRALLDKVAEAARKGASSQTRIFALVESYPIEVERGNDAEIEELRSQLNETRSLYPQGYFLALQPAEAMREAWNGSFAEAYATIVRDLPETESSERLALRLSQAALYAFAAGMQDEGTQALERAAHALEGTNASARRAVQTQTYLALAELVRGHTGAAHRRLSEAERSAAPRMKRLRAFIAAVRAAYRIQLGQSDAAAFDAALELLRAEHYGGIARLLASLPMSGDRGNAFASLTAAEREILEILATGASTKEVAGRTGRSPHTVDTHIRSICRKLSCSGRREAVALATSQGWVHR